MNKRRNLMTFLKQLTSKTAKTISSFPFVNSHETFCAIYCPFHLVSNGFQQEKLIGYLINIGIILYPR